MFCWRTPQLFQPKGTPLVQGSRGAKFVFSAAKFCRAWRQSVPNPTNTVGEAMVLPPTKPCGATSDGEIAPPNTFIRYNLLFVPAKNIPVFQASWVTEPTTRPLRVILSKN